MTEQEIQAVLRAQAHIDSRKRAMISMALGKMKDVLKKKRRCYSSKRMGKILLSRS